MDKPPSGKEESTTASQSDESRTHEVEVKSSNGTNKNHERYEGLISRYHKQICKEQTSTDTRRDLEKKFDVKTGSSTDGMEGRGSAKYQTIPNRANINHRQTKSNPESMTVRVARARRNAMFEGSEGSEGVDDSKTTRVTMGSGKHGLVSADSGGLLEPSYPSVSSPITIPPRVVLPPHHVGSEGVYRDATGLSSKMSAPEESKSRTTASESPKYKLQVDASSFGHTVGKMRTPRSMSDGFGATVAMYNKLKDLSVELEQNKGEERVGKMKRKTKNAGMKDDAKKNR
ncbi:predicted protein [Sclerotinia sclerotiorum 1980 UF-70]|uniref:Uncharacterized protein n=2 Tax=Sclerotinia sclerotiorum (strain ATCC 18683 / 1980 / Ss-1) TaxID=665079 RepID=A7EP95_SCLS1|nr:predicted protein [Sclerotinia sclerotiorum 1980 UF-70]APA10381.1 hypothetical protein sscle_06g051510 [Sclerotinia sclerotiorum 1980 UF-70]EDO04661.1 predicted protein [Sclerotinia sclerotiorum 1980 UF-70]